MQVLYDESLEEPPAADRLRAMINMLASGAEIDAAMRREIIDALKRHEIRRANDALRNKRGRSIDHATWFAAFIAKELRDKHGAKSVKAAVAAAAESVKWQRGLNPRAVTLAECSVITRAMQKLNKSEDGFIETKDGGKFKVALVTSAWIDDAAARLAGQDRTMATPDQAHGAIAILTDPITEKPTDR